MKVESKHYLKCDPKKGEHFLGEVAKFRSGKANMRCNCRRVMFKKGGQFKMVKWWDDEGHGHHDLMLGFKPTAPVIEKSYKGAVEQMRSFVASQFAKGNPKNYGYWAAWDKMREFLDSLVPREET